MAQPGELHTRGFCEPDGQVLRFEGELRKQIHGRSALEHELGYALSEEIASVVASELDPSTERIINYLSDNYGVPIDAVFFRFFRDDGRDYLARTWLIAPEEAERKTSKSKVKKGGEAWNGHDFYVSLGEGERSCLLISDDQQDERIH